MSGSRIRRSDDVYGFVKRTFFKIGPPRTVGIELETLVLDRARPGELVPPERSRPLIEAAGPMGRGSIVTYEPGGQVELSTAPLVGTPAAVEALAVDLADLRIRLAGGGIEVVLSGLDPVRLPRRCTEAPRYAAMENYFDRRGPEGRAMMTTTAALQISLDAGADPSDVARRWHTANEIGPVLTAMFANSPLQCGAVTGWRSSRARVWSRMDPLRTTRPTGDDPAEAYARYALAAPVMCVSRPEGPWLPAPGVTFAEWIAGALPEPPTEADLELHLTTLFPPVRAREWLELRGIDALPEPWWPVPVILSEVLLADPVAGEAARAAAAEVAGRDLDGARLGLTDPGFRRAAAAFLEAGIAALRRRPVVGPAVVDGLPTPDVGDGPVGAFGAPEPAALLERYAERYVSRGRTPADDVLDAIAAGLPPWEAALAPASAAPVLRGELWGTGAPELATLISPQGSPSAPAKERA